MTESKEWPSTQASLLHRLHHAPTGTDWSVFVEIYQPLIYRACRRRLRQEADARDVTQSVLLQLQKGLKAFEYDPARGKFRGWLGTIIWRELAEYRKKQQQAGQGRGGSSGANEITETQEDQAGWIVEFNSHVYQAAIDRVRPEFKTPEWEAFEATWLNKEEPPAVAQRSGRPVEWIYRSKYKVLKRLREEIMFLTAEIPGFHQN